MLRIVAVLLALAAPALSQGAAAPPSFVFLLADDLGWRDLGCYGSSFYETPNLDGLAAGGMRFSAAYAACPVCSPTRASILTGKYPARLHTTDYFGGARKGKLLPAKYQDRVPLEEETLAEALRAAGYRTFFVGKWHLGPKGFWPEDQGFEVNVAGGRNGHPPKGYFSPYGMAALEDGPKGEHLTERLTDEALRLIDSAQGEPFLLYLSYYAVHTPLQTRPEYRAKYEKKREGLPPHDGPAWRPEGERRTRLVQDHAVYAGMVQSLDESVGRVLDKLDELGIADRTVVLFMSDNGGLSTSEGHPTANLPLRAGKGWLYEGGIREPMIVRWPGVTAPGSTSDRPVISTDFYPTILEIAGLEPRPRQHVDGVSFAPILRGAEPAAREAIYWHYPHYGNQGGSPSAAVRRGDDKLIEWFEDGRVELYDLAHDLGEQHDLAEAKPELAAELRAVLHAWRRDVGAAMPTPNPDWRQKPTDAGK